ncbi:MAG: hypothetical protein QM802_18860 [Agriterribacter sp.]
MKTKLLYLGMGILFLFISTATFSQVQIGVHGSRLEGTGSSQWGFGANVKFLVADHFAIGIAGRAYPKNVKTNEMNVNGNNYKILAGNTIVPVTASLDYYFGKAPVRPYLGVDAGAYFRQNIATIIQSNESGAGYSNKFTDKKTFFGAAPRAGLNIELGPVGIFGQAGYNFLFGSGDKNNVTVPGVNAEFDTKPTDKFWTFDVGLFFKIGGK